MICCVDLEELKMFNQDTGTFGELLRQWREARRMSQLELGLEAQVSSRHISFIETGRARPSRAMIIALSSVLDVPLRERNALLHAAGFAPVYRETSLNDPQMAQVRQALELILRQQEPFGAIVFDRNWELIMANAAYVRLANFQIGKVDGTLVPYTVTPAPRLNLVRLLFDPAGWRPHIVNWEIVARGVLTRLQREANWDCDAMTRELLRSVLAYPGVPARWSELDFDVPQDLIIPVEISLGERTLRLFSTITTLGSPQDITLQELRIEALHPADEETERIVRALAVQF
jgi:transcriptional regulator with XRE-family HTH domain